MNTFGCDNCQKGVENITDGILVHVERNGKLDGTVNEKWCLDCIRGTGTEREMREKV
ncbi:MAG: hypothetical protein WA461_13405 [Nitrososphaeraceae archaeon]